MDDRAQCINRCCIGTDQLINTVNCSLYAETEAGSFCNFYVNSKTLAFTFGLVSEIESKLISARTKEALTASKNKGTKLGRPLGSPKTEFLLSQKSQIERELKEENATYAELADYYKVSLSGFKRFIRENIPNLPSRRKKKNDTE